MELNEKLARWAGFTWYDEPCSYEGCDGHCGWRYPDGTTIYPLGMRGLPSFTQSLDACFKWLVPQVPNLESVSFIFNRMECIAQFYYLDKGKPQARLATSTTPALALCKAIEKLIDGGKE